MRTNPDWIYWTNRILQAFCILLAIVITIAWLTGFVEE